MREAFRIAHIETMDVFRLNRSDNMGMRYQAPALMICHGIDQEAFDFMKWHATAGSDSHYDWGNMDLPFLNLRGENVPEPDLHSLKQSASVADKLPQELLDNCREDLVSNAVAGHSDLLQEVRDGVDISPRTKDVEGQVDTLFKAVTEANSFFWPAMIEPGGHLHALPAAYSSGSVDEMQISLQANYAAWEEKSPEAIAWIGERIGKRVRGGGGSVAICCSQCGVVDAVTNDTAS
ncbi:hypothetical protein DOTSEDRAFT_57478 [Dothistroma septosporum NZE10]|uniref:Uncharacterized protein n=1 Tax=Dothistroma septosporum (strain NZE10 / CBS 128990) TaxID=675120 RepID=N1PDT5_DOTSN|nr:hypothetical protein DOTSEDRAFT_57478 [Dothistroma septosporum NZE10]